MADKTLRIEVIVDDNGAVKQIRDVDNALDKISRQTVPAASSSFGALTAAFAAGTVGGEVLARGFGLITSELASGIAAAKEAEQIHRRLGIALQNSLAPVDKNLAAFEMLAQEIERTSVIEDDAAKSAMAYATSLGVLPTEMRPVITAAADLSAALGISLDQAITKIVRAGEGQTVAFTRMGISLDKARAETEGLSYVVGELNKRFAGQAQAEAETYQGLIDQLSNAYGNFKEAIGGVVTSSETLAWALRTVTTTLRGLTLALSDAEFGLKSLKAAMAHGGILGAVEFALKMGGAWKDLANSAEDGAAAARRAMDKTSEGFGKILSTLDKLSDRAAKQSEKDAKAAESAWKKFANEFQKDIDRQIQMADRLTVSIKRFNDELEKSLQMRLFLAETQRNATPTLDPSKGIGGLLPMQTGQVPGLPSVVSWTGNGFAIVQEKTRVSITAGMSDAFARFPAMMAQSLTGGGGVGGAFQALGSEVGSTIGANIAKSIGNSLGKTMGKVFESLLPGIGAMLGPLIGWIGDKLFKTEGKKVNDLRDAYIGAAGGLAVLGEKARVAGLTLDRLLQAKTVKEYEAAIAQLNDELAKTAALQAELAALQQQLADRQIMDWQKAEELIAKYGGTLSDLGKAFVEAKQAASWKEVWDDWQTLIDMGADVGGVLFQMKDEIQNLVQQSLDIGTTIPAQFKPLIEELIRTGQLFDKNGEAITDIAQLSFGPPLVSEVDKIIEAINRLIDTLNNKLAPAFNNAFTIPDGPGGSGGGRRRGDEELPSFASGGWGDFGSGRLAMLHGREAIIPLDRPSRIGARFGGSTTVIINDPQIDSAVGLDRLTRKIEQALDRAARRSRVM